MTSVFKNSLVFLFCAGLAAAGSGCGSLSTLGADGITPSETVVISADYPSYPSASEATSAAEVIVVGTWIDSKEVLLPPDLSTDDVDAARNPQAGVEVSRSEKESMSVPTTVSRIRVKTVLKGKVSPGSVLEVSQIGGFKDGKRYVEESTALLKDVKSSADFLLFLSSYSDTVVMDMINPEVGAWTVTGQKIEPIPHPDGKTPPFSLAQVGDVTRIVLAQEK